MASKTNETAIELWRQVLSRLSTQDNAAILDPNYDGSADEKRMREAFAHAGWSDALIEGVVEEQRKSISSAPVTSPGINPGAEAMFETLCNDIEAAMDRLKLTSHARLARGIEPRLGPYAAKTNVVMTDESFVTVGAHLFRFCGLIARAYTRTNRLDPYRWGAERYDKKAASKLLLSSPELLKYWLMIFISYAAMGTNSAVPFQPSKKHELLLFEQVARSMEVFAIAHEYGHHHFDHGRQIGGDPHQEEIDADKFALRISYEIERRPVIYLNPYLPSGAGGILFLLAFETLRSVEGLFGGAKAQNSDTHPDVRSRIARFESIAILKPEEFVALRTFRLACTRIMDLAHSEVLSILKALPSNTLKGIVPVKFGSE